MFYKHLTLTLCSLQVFATLYSIKTDLSSEEMNSVVAGNVVIKTKETNGKWPIVIMYQNIHASPLESVAVFYALDHQKNYVPNLTQSDVIKHLSPTKVLTKYTMQMPWPLSDSHYVHGSELTHKRPANYRVNWWLESSDTAKKVEGYAEFIPHEQGTLMKYHSFVEPKSIFATFVKSKMISDVQNFMKIVNQEIVKLKNSNKNLMKKYVSFIDNALKGANVYQK